MVCSWDMILHTDAVAPLGFGGSWAGEKESTDQVQDGCGQML